jgi:tRNA(fMet)-specific endonuclease VapC
MGLYVLDTDHVSLHQRHDLRIIAKIKNLSPSELATTIVTFEEQMRGRLAQVAKSGSNSPVAYDQLSATANYFCGLTILPFDALAQQQYQLLRSQKIRIGTLDLRIAAIVLRHDAILITRNRRDFEQVSGLELEDWSQ